MLIEIGYRGLIQLQYMLTSIDEHSDKGFGVTADAFKKAADKLTELDFTANTIIQGNMPILYLYRHSIELYLKSLILHIHEELKIPFLSTAKSGDHPFTVNDKDKPIFVENCHSLKILFEYLCKIVKDNEQSLISNAPEATWLITGRIRSYMKSLSDLDDKSDYFRYPVSRNQSKDKEKHTMKKIKIKQLNQLLGEPGGKMILATKNKDGVIQDIYIKDEKILKEIFITLKATSDFFNNYHIMTRLTLCKGW